MDVIGNIYIFLLPKVADNFAHIIKPTTTKKQKQIKNNKKEERKKNTKNKTKQNKKQNKTNKQQQHSFNITEYKVLQ